MKPHGTLLLTRSQIAQLLTLDECIAAMEHIFRLYGEGKASPPGILGVHAHGGGFHIKAGVIDQERNYFVAKCNANFPQNSQRYDLPTIQGTILLADADNGYPLAIMDSIEVTIRRTGAATAVAANYLAKKDSQIITICGCGSQGRNHLQSLLRVRPLRQAFVYDIDERQSRLFTEEFSGTLAVEPVVKENLPASIRKSDICVTCTTSKQFFVRHEDVLPGTFVAAVGADNEEKQEIDPQLFVANKVVADMADQSATIGDAHHAITLGLINKSGIHAELGEIVAGKKAGRTSDDEIIIFDSTGMALQDVAASALVYEKAVALGTGTMLNLNDT